MDDPKLGIVRCKLLYLDGRIIRKRNSKYLRFLNNLKGWVKPLDVCIAPIIATYKSVEGLEMKNEIHGLFYKDANDDFIRRIKQVLKNMIGTL